MVSISPLKIKHKTTTEQEYKDMIGLSKRHKRAPLSVS